MQKNACAERCHQNLKQKLLNGKNNMAIHKHLKNKKVQAGTNATIFILFFCIALIEALQVHNWFLAGLFIALGVLSLYADNFRK